MRAGIAACQPKKWLDLFGFDLADLAPLLPVQMHCGLADPPNAVVESRSTPDIAVKLPSEDGFHHPNLWTFGVFLGVAPPWMASWSSFLNLILAKDWSGSQAND